MRRPALWLSVLAVFLLTGAQATAVTLDPIGSFTDPVFVTSEPNNSDRLLVVEQEGKIERSVGGVVTPYLDLTGLVASGGERGLLSAAPAPDYATSGLLYVYYTAIGGDIQIDEFRASEGSVSLATRRPVLTIDHPIPNHNGGQLQFGPDGYLYIGTGDGGGAGDQSGNAQNLNTLLGKILRIDPRAAGAAPYSIPPGNPFAGPTTGADEIWSFGLRNPWRFAFDRLSGDLVIGDVGQNAWEEVDYVPAPAAGRGLNFGWNRCEGFNVFPATNPPAGCTVAGMAAPVLAYGHTGGACSITGGYVVRDASLGDLYGRYLFADACNSRVSSVRLGLPAATDLRQEPFTAPRPSSFGEDACARVYLASLGADAVYRLAGDVAPACPSATPGPGEAPLAVPAQCGGEQVTRASPDGGRFEGSANDDVIVGGPKRDRIVGLGGDDVICGLAGKDVLRGGGGSDKLRGGRGDDRCDGGRGRTLTRSC